MMSNKTDSENQAAARPPALPPYIDRSWEQQWLNEHSKEFAGQWVALAGTHLLSHGPSARAAYEAAKQSGIKRPLVVQVEPNHELPFGGWLAN